MVEKLSPRVVPIGRRSAYNGRLMIHAGSGISMLDDTEEAARAAVQQALQGMEPGLADLAFVFTTPSHGPALGRVSALIKELTLAREIVGCTGSGVFTLGGTVEGGAGLAVLLVQSDREVLFDPLWIEKLGPRSAAAGEEIGRRAAAHEDGVVVLLPDVQTFQPAPFFEAVASVSPVASVVGGAASDDGSRGKAFQVQGDRVASGGASGVVLGGPFRRSLLVTHSCLPVAEPVEITKVNGNALLEIGGRPAYESFVEFVNEHLDGDLGRSSGVVLVAISDPAGSGGDYYIRQVMGVDPESGVVALSESVSTGQQIAFALREPRGAWQNLQRGLAKLRERRGNRPPAFGLYFNCAARTSHFFGAPSVDMSLIQGTLGQFPLAGFFGGAELAPLVGRNRTNYFSGVLLLGDPAE